MSRPSQFSGILACLVAGLVVPSGRAQDQSTCALLRFDNSSGRAGAAYLASVIDQALYPTLRATEVWQLVERQRLRELLEESDLKSAGIVTGQPIELAGADLIIVGEYRDDEGVVSVAARLVSTGDGKVVRTAQWRGHVSGLWNDMAPRVAAMLAGQPEPEEELSQEMQALFEKACQYLARDRLDRAIDACTTILEAHRDHVPTLLLRGHAQLLKKGWARYARKDFERVLEIDDDVMAARIGLAQVCFGGDDRSTVKGLKWLDEVLEVMADHGEALYLAALGYEKLREEEKALKCADAVVVVMTEFSPAWRLRSRLLLAAGKKVEALKSAMKATAFDPDDPRAWVQLGDVHQAIGDRPAAKESFQKALTCEPPPRLEEQIKMRLLQFD